MGILQAVPELMEMRKRMVRMILRMSSISVFTVVEMRGILQQQLFMASLMEGWTTKWCWKAASRVSS